jgi:hypothetical protein
MKPNHIFGAAFLFFTLVLVLILANFNPPFAAAQNTGAAITLQTTPTPVTEGISEIGSTDGIMLMGAVITLIIAVPLLLRIKKK